MKKWIEAAFLITIVGVQFDLLLIGHYESVWQYLPLITLPLTLVVALVHRQRPNTWLQWSMRTLSVGLIAMAMLGVYFHLKSNFEFELEMRPSLSGMPLWSESLTGALPVFAPASLIPLALLNYVLSELNESYHEIANQI